MWLFCRCVRSDPLGSGFLTVKIDEDFYRIPKALRRFMVHSSRTLPFETKFIADDTPREDGAQETRSELAGKAEETTAPNSTDSDYLTVQLTEDLYRVPKSLCHCLGKTPPIEAFLTKPKRIQIDGNACEEMEASTFTEEESEYLTDDEIYTDLDDLPRKSRRQSVIAENCAEYEYNEKSQRYKRRKIDSRSYNLLLSYKCVVCKKSFDGESALANHMEIHDDGAQNGDDAMRVTSSMGEDLCREQEEIDCWHQCEHCEKRYASKFELEFHRSSHLGTKSFVCDVCGNAYSQDTYLRYHRRLIHRQRITSSTMAYKCSKCEKTFVSEYCLQRHVDLHSLTFLCSQCGLFFATSRSLRMHMLTHQTE